MRATICSLLLSSSALAAPLVVKDGVATATLRRTYVKGEPSITVTFELPAGWRETKPTFDGGVTIVPADAKYDRPQLRLNVQIDNTEPSQIDKAIADKLEAEKTKVVGGGTAKRLRKKARPDGAYQTLAIDAKKQRSIVYTETSCYVGKPGQPYVVALVGFTEQAGAKALVPLFEKTCLSLKIVP
jgi:hypothetical protein